MNFMIIHVQKVIYGLTDGQPKTIVRNLTKKQHEQSFYVICKLTSYCIYKDYPFCKKTKYKVTNNN